VHQVNQLMVIFSDWESKLNDRVRTEVATQLDLETRHWKTTLDKLEDRIENCELKVETQRSETYAKVMECDTKISSMLDRGLEMKRDYPECSNNHTDYAHNEDRKHVKEIIKEAVNQQQMEDKEIDSRKNNVILYNIPENREERYDARLATDKNFIVTMCDDVAGVQLTDQSISKCIRLGASEEGKMRPILLSVTSETTKDGIMKMGKDLGLS